MAQGGDVMRVTFEREVAGERCSFTADVRGPRYAGNGLDPPDPREVEYLAVEGPRGPERWEEFTARLAAALGDRACESALDALDAASVAASDDALGEAAEARHPYRTADAPHYQCGRGHPYVGDDPEPRRWYCGQGECGRWSGVFFGPEGERRRVRAVFVAPPAAGDVYRHRDDGDLCRVTRGPLPGGFYFTDLHAGSLGSPTAADLAGRWQRVAAGASDAAFRAMRCTCLRCRAGGDDMAPPAVKV